MKFTPDLSGKVDGMGFPSKGRASTAVASIIFLLATSSQLEMSTVLLGYDVAAQLGAAAFSIGSLSVTWAAIVSFGSIAAVYSFNNRKLTEFGDHQSYLAYTVVFGVALLTLSPPIRDAVAGSTALSYAVTGLMTLGFVAIAEYGGGYE